MENGFDGGAEMRKRMKKLIIGSTVAATMLALAESARQAVAGYFVNIAIKREAPPYPARAERRLTGSRIEEHLLQAVNEAGQKLALQEQETVRIQSRDGICLVGHWVRVKHPKRLIIAMHGWRSSWSHDFGMIADFFQENQCSVLYPEQRGQGGSGGEYIGFGLMERYDCLDWIDWVNEQTGGSCPVYLCGISMGASTVLMTADLQLPSNVCGIIADCGYTEPTAIWKHVAQNHLHLNYSTCGGPASRKARKKIRMKVDETSCPKALANAKVPVLFIHGTDDRFVPVEMTYENYKACAGPKQLLIVPGAEHGMSYVVAPQEYEATVKAFWRAFDKGVTS